MAPALDVLGGKVIGRCMQRHRHQEFIRFLNAIEAQVPARRLRDHQALTAPQLGDRGRPRPLKTGGAPWPLPP
jgi:hypothetical protein